jgi:Tfp pilus assembly protein PilV
MLTVRALRNDRGVALIMALVVILILVAIVLGVAQITTSEVEIHRLVRWDTLAQYLGQAGVEHQIYLSKGNKDALAVPSTNYPVLPGETAGSGKLWYFTTLTCTLNCTGNPETRRWTINSFGEIRDCPTACTTVLHQRTVRGQVEIRYVDCGTPVVVNGCPSSVTLLRWEEVYP